MGTSTGRSPSASLNWLERLPVLDPYIIRKAFKHPSGHAKTANKAHVLAYNNVRELVCAQVGERARRRADIFPMHDPPVSVASRGL
jgi:hypothetical protein